MVTKGTFGKDNQCFASQNALQRDITAKNFFLRHVVMKKKDLLRKNEENVHHFRYVASQPLRGHFSGDNWCW